MQTHVEILGPHPGNWMYSICNYFNFCRRNLPPLLEPIRVKADAPGDGVQAFEDETFPVSSRVRARFDLYAKWPTQLLSKNAEVCHIVDQGLAWYSKFLRSARIIVTVHDLIALMASRGVLDVDRSTKAQNLLLRPSMDGIRKAQRVIAVSSETADCLMRYLGIPSERISVIHDPIESTFYPLCNAERRTAREKWFADAEHAIIHVGTPWRYKNRIGAIKSFALVRSRLPGAQLYLIHGEPTVSESRFVEQASLADATHFLPPVKRSELREIYGAADALIFPSLYEGFGWPPAEAMACGCPVVCTTAGALREVVSDAALVVNDPRDHKSLAEHLICVLTQSGVADELRCRGFRNVARFAPSMIANGIADVYRGVF
jgi:glycosyltransferase involved in cell wall biosynthesis